MRTSRTAKKIQLVANVASIITCVAVTGFAILIAVALVQNSSGSRISAQAGGQHPLTVGDKISGLDIDWRANDKTLLMALNKGCGFCRASAPFYQTLANEESEGRIPAKLVAVLPQEVSEGKQYLGELEVPLHEVRQARLDSLGVRGTPTLILVDKSGIVTDTWVGQLSKAQEAEVLSRLRTSAISQ
jgi:thioredoxin-related protein